MRKKFLLGEDRYFLMSTKLPRSSDFYSNCYGLKILRFLSILTLISRNKLNMWYISIQCKFGNPGTRNPNDRHIEKWPPSQWHMCCSWSPPWCFATRRPQPLSHLQNYGDNTMKTLFFTDFFYSIVTWE